MDDFLTDEQMAGLERKAGGRKTAPDFMTDEQMQAAEGTSTGQPPTDDQVADAERERIRNIVRPPLSKQLSFESASNAITEMGESIPLIGSAAKKMAQTLLPEGAAEYERERARRYRDAPDVMGAGRAIGTFGGAMMLPSPAGKVDGVFAGPLARAAEAGAVAGTDAELRGDNGLAPGATAAGLTGLAGLVTPRAYNRVLGGVPDKVQDYYVANRDLVNAARPREELRQAMAQEGKKLSQEVSSGSGKSFRMLEDSGVAIPVSELTGPIDEAMKRLAKSGKYGASKTAIKDLQQLRKDLIDDLAESSPEIKAIDEAIGSGSLKPDDLKKLQLNRQALIDELENASIPADKVKSFVNAFRQKTEPYATGPMGRPVAGMGYITATMKGTDKAMDGALKRAVPEYAEHMGGLSKATGALKGVRKALKDENSADAYIKRIMRERDPEGLKALRDFDQIRGTKFADEIKASYTKEFFEKPNIHGSRQVNLWKEFPGLSKLPGGKFIGGAVGAAQDIYARKIGKVLLDLSASPSMRTWAPLIRRAGEKSPFAVMGLHGLLYDRDESYRKVIEQLTSEDAP